MTAFDCKIKNKSVTKIGRQSNNLAKLIIHVLLYDGKRVPGTELYQRVLLYLNIK